MFIESHHLVYPEGEIQEIQRPLRFNSLVDMNGNPLQLPLQTHRMIVYRVYRIRHDESRGERAIYYHLELVRGEELFSLVHSTS